MVSYLHDERRSNAPPTTITQTNGHKKVRQMVDQRTASDDTKLNLQFMCMPQDCDRMSENNANKKNSPPVNQQPSCVVLTVSQVFLCAASCGRSQECQEAETLPPSDYQSCAQGGRSGRFVDFETKRLQRKCSVSCCTVRSRAVSACVLDYHLS